jgi:predicted transcriptional regulator
VECGGLPECFHGFKELDKKGFQALVRSEEALTVDEIADAVDRKRSTAYRAVQRPLQTGFIGKDQINYDEGGYYHVYSPTGSSKIADDTERLLND